MKASSVQKIKLICDCCKHPEMIETSYLDVIDSYLLTCPICQAEKILHFTNYDSLMGNYDDYEDMSNIDDTLTPLYTLQIKSREKSFEEKISQQFERFKDKWAKQSMTRSN